MHAPRRIRFSTLCAALVLVLFACALAAPFARASSHVAPAPAAADSGAVALETTNWDLPAVLGSTYWDCESGDPRPRSMVAIELYDRAPRRAALREMVLAHEAEHRAYRLEQGSCHAAREALGQHWHKLRSEVRAWCAWVRVGVARQYYRDTEAAVQEAARFLTLYDFAPRSVHLAHALISAECGATGPPHLVSP